MAYSQFLTKSRQYKTSSTQSNNKNARPRDSSIDNKGVCKNVPAGCKEIVPEKLYFYCNR